MGKALVLEPVDWLLTSAISITPQAGYIIFLKFIFFFCHKVVCGKYDHTL